MEVKIGNLILKNPIMPASGTFGYGIEYKDFIDLNKIGAIVTKGISLKPKIGNPPPRLLEGDGYLMNFIGLENVGVEAFLKEKLPLIENFDTKIIVNFFGNSVEEYCRTAEILSKNDRIDALEVNISCPNVKKGGIEFGLFPEEIFNLIKKIRNFTSKTLIVKVSPQISDIIGVADAIEKAGADAITVINTIKGLRINVNTEEYFYGGISGNFLKPIALRFVDELVKCTSLPVIGCGGIKNFDDVKEFLIAGAIAVQIGTFNFVEPDIIERIIEKLNDEGKVKKNNSRNRGPSRITKCSVQNFGEDRR